MKRYWIDFADTIKEIEVIREAEKSFTTSDIYGAPTRHMKSGDHHETWESARQELLRRFEDRATSLYAQMLACKSRIREIKEMKEP